jgi:hypothetical protein
VQVSEMTNRVFDDEAEQTNVSSRPGPLDRLAQGCDALRCSMFDCSSNPHRPGSSLQVH